MFFFLQKQSPFLDDMNSFIHLARQMGVIEMSYYSNIPNATKCKSTYDIYESHIEKDHTVEVELDDIYGMLALLGLGMVGALITFMAENMLKLMGNQVEFMNRAIWWLIHNAQ